MVFDYPVLWQRMSSVLLMLELHKDALLPLARRALRKKVRDSLRLLDRSRRESRTAKLRHRQLNSRASQHGGNTRQGKPFHVFVHSDALNVTLTEVN